MTPMEQMAIDIMVKGRSPLEASQVTMMTVDECKALWNRHIGGEHVEAPVNDTPPAPEPGQ